MAALLVVHPLLRRLYNAVTAGPAATNGSTKPTPEAAEARLNQRASFDYAFAFIYLTALHGFSALKILLILYINYNIATMVPRKYMPVVTWAFNICTLFANELCGGYRFKDMAMLVSGSSGGALGSSDSALVEAGAWMDSWGGLMSRWEILFNITILRLISFNLDYYWSVDRRSSSPIEVRSECPPPPPPHHHRVRCPRAHIADVPKKKQLDPANLSERDRVTIPAPAQDFTFRNYLAYAVYAPLYLTGPIITFNDYVSQLRYRPATIETPRTARYAVRLALCLLAMELVLHYDYVGAISKSSPDWSSYTPAQLSLLSFFNLHIIWLKLLLPWRLFRLWALADGVDPPENMLRCVSNNFSALSFWRGWHRSYYRWLIRYIYVPLGGSDFGSAARAARSVATYLMVFTFVALWHDIQLRLLIWGWLIVFFMVPEMAAGYLFPARRWAARPTAYRMLCCVGCVGNVLMMMAANLVGFAVGLDGLQTILQGILHDYSGTSRPFTPFAHSFLCVVACLSLDAVHKCSRDPPPGFFFLVTACSALFVGIQVMFEIRQSERRKGISLNC